MQLSGGMLGKKPMVGFEDSPVYFNPEIIRENLDSKMVEVQLDEDWKDKPAPQSSNLECAKEKHPEEVSMYCFQRWEIAIYEVASGRASRHVFCHFY